MPFGFTDDDAPAVDDDDVAVSSSVMLMVAVLGVPMIALLVGLLSVIAAVSVPSEIASLRIFTVNVLLVSFAANVSVPLIASKSEAAVAEFPATT